MVGANVKWTGKRQFVGTGEKSENSITIDLAKQSGGDNSGVRPTEVFLLGIASCTAVDMVNILTKMKVKLTRCEVKIEGEQREDYPKYFHTIRLHYLLSGEDLNHTKAEKALTLSLDKYCAVSQTLKDRAKFETKIEII